VLATSTNHKALGPHRVPSYYNAIIVALALAYGAACSAIPSDSFKDWANYLNYAEDSSLTLSSLWQLGFIVTLTNEPVWLLINSGLALLLPPEAVVRTIIFVSATLVAWLVLRADPRHFAMLLGILFLPQVVKNHLIHLRQGAAIAVFLAGWFSGWRPLRWFLMFLAPFIHLSFTFVWLLMALASVTRYLRFAWDLRALTFVCAGVAVGNLLAWVAALMGARQAGLYAFASADVSGLGFAFWLAICLLMILQGSRFMREHAFQMGAVLFYLATYFLIEVTARIFESVIVLVLLAGLHMTSWRRMVFFGAIAVYGGLQWILRSESPSMGFGI
jgi:hypothetical protein